MAMSNDSQNLLTLPYDVRFLIYEHVFPPGKQVYIQAMPDKLRSITPEHNIPTALLQTCKQLHSEASEYLYNNYLFNIVGRKTEVLALYKSFNKTVEKYARDEVHVDPFSNGEHSATMCISLHTGDGKMDTLLRRHRGVAMKIQEVQAEVGYYGRKATEPLSLLFPLRISGYDSWGLFAISGLSVLVALLAWYTSLRLAYAGQD